MNIYTFDGGACLREMTFGDTVFLFPTCSCRLLTISDLNVSGVKVG